MIKGIYKKNLMAKPQMLPTKIKNKAKQEICSQHLFNIMVEVLTSAMK
jgi:hypothetical protein